MSTAAKRMITAKELAELTRQIRNLQKRCKRAEIAKQSPAPRISFSGTYMVLLKHTMA